MKKYYKVGTTLIAFLTIAVFTTGFTFNSSTDLTDDDYRKFLTGQIWAVQIEAEPGESGSLNQEFEAAHGPYDSDVKDGSADEVQKDSFGFDYDDDGNLKVVKGEDYVGDYFHIEQEAGTTGGTTRRYIDVSSPWSGAYLHEDMTVIGKTDIVETFTMDNLKPGKAAIPGWHDLF